MEQQQEARAAAGAGDEPLLRVLSQWASAGYVLAMALAKLLLRAPAFYLLELWWLSQIDAAFGAASEYAKGLMESGGGGDMFEMVHMSEFVKTRNLDHSAAAILRCSALFCVSLLLLLPMHRLTSVYLHAASFLLIGLGHYMSNRYIQLEVETGGEVLLDDFVKLERHGFHLLAQVMLSLSVSCLLGVQSQGGRAALAAYSAPIVARMVGCPPARLHAVHNCACSFTMMLIAFYLLALGPDILKALKDGYRQVQSTLSQHGAFEGVALLWKRMHMRRTLAVFWLALFLGQCYGKLAPRLTDPQLRQVSLRMAPVACLGIMAECTSSPVTLLALAAAVSYASAMVVALVKCWLFGPRAAAARREDAHTSLMHSGYAEGATLILLAGQTGLLGLQLAQRAFLLGLVMFIVLSALMQSLLDLLEPHLLTMGPSLHASLGRHGRAAIVTMLLIVGPVLLVCGIANLLPFDIWLLIIMSNCLLTSIQTLSAFALYLLFYIEARCSEPWERLDDLIFYCRAGGKCCEFALAVLVIAYGAYQSIWGHWSVLSSLVLLVHSYFNVWRRLEAGWASFAQRRLAAENMRLLASASAEQLRRHQDVCAICFQEMSDARITPCGHYFHGLCLRKWLFVKQSCPMCHKDVEFPPRRRADNADGAAEEGYSSGEDESRSRRSSSRAAGWFDWPADDDDSGDEFSVHRMFENELM